MAKVFRAEEITTVLKKATECFEEIELEQKRTENRFLGAGVYALFYTGKNGIYSPIRSTPSRQIPIYRIKRYLAVGGKRAHQRQKKAMQKYG